MFVVSEFPCTTSSDLYNASFSELISPSANHVTDKQGKAERGVCACVGVRA